MFFCVAINVSWEFNVISCLRSAKLRQRLSLSTTMTSVRNKNRTERQIPSQTWRLFDVVNRASPKSATYTVTATFCTDRYLAKMKNAYFDGETLVDEQVWRLQIAMHDRLNNEFVGSISPSESRTMRSDVGVELGSSRERRVRVSRIDQQQQHTRARGVPASSYAARRRRASLRAPNRPGRRCQQGRDCQRLDWSVGRLVID